MDNGNFEMNAEFERRRPLLTVIVPTYNEEATIERLLLAVLEAPCMKENPYQPFVARRNKQNGIDASIRPGERDKEVIVIDDCSTDLRPRFLKDFVIIRG